MDELIVKYLRGEATNFEVRRLEDWRAAADANDRAFQETRRLWEKTNDLAMPLVDAAPPVSHTVSEAEKRRRGTRGVTRRREALRSPWALLGVGAAAVLVTLLLVDRTDRGSVGSESVFAPVESSSSPLDITTMALTDGSVLRLAPDTRVEFLPSADSRELVLEGKAFFAVAPDPKPFVVQAQAGRVVVHGTRFEILTWGDSLRLVVVEGDVSLRGTSGAAEVGAGQVAFLREGAPPRVLEGEDIWPVLDWPGGLLVFQETPLSQVIREIGRHFSRDARVTDEEIGQRHITAWFEDETLEEVLTAVCHVAGARYQIIDGEVTIGR